MNIYPQYSTIILNNPQHLKIELQQLLWWSVLVYGHMKSWKSLILAHQALEGSDGGLECGRSCVMCWTANILRLHWLHPATTLFAPTLPLPFICRSLRQVDASFLLHIGVLLWWFALTFWHLKRQRSEASSCMIHVQWQPQTLYILQWIGTGLLLPIILNECASHRSS